MLAPISWVLWHVHVDFTLHSLSSFIKLHYSSTFPGQDYASIKMNATTGTTAEDCQNICCTDQKCRTWVYVPAGLYSSRPVTTSPHPLRFLGQLESVCIASKLPLPLYADVQHSDDAKSCQASRNILLAKGGAYPLERQDVRQR